MKQHWANEWHSCFFCTRNKICAGENLASRDTNEELEEPQQIQRYKAEAAIKPQINNNVEIFLLVFLFVFVTCFVPRDHWQITFVMLNRFCLLCKTSHPLLLMDDIKLDGIPSKNKWKLDASFTLYFKSYRYFL